MRQLIDQLKVWSAMRDQDQGIVDYDRLSQAGTPGEIVMHNMLGRMLDEVTHGSGVAHAADRAEHDRVELRLGGTTTYPQGGHLLLNEGVVLSADVLTSHDAQIGGVTMQYGLANDPETMWHVVGPQKGRAARIFGGVRAPMQDIVGRLTSDYRYALDDPESFVLRVTERFANAEGLAQLSFLGQEAVHGLTVASQIERRMHA